MDRATLGMLAAAAALAVGTAAGCGKGAPAEPAADAPFVMDDAQCKFDAERFCRDKFPAPDLLKPGEWDGCVRPKYDTCVRTK